MATVVTLSLEKTLRHLVLEDRVWLQLVLETVGLVDLDLFLMSVGVSSAGDGDY